MLYNELKKGDYIATQSDWTLECITDENNQTKRRPLRSYYQIKEVRDDSLSVVQMKHELKKKKLPNGQQYYRYGWTTKRTRYRINREDCKTALWIKDLTGDLWNPENDREIVC